MDVGDPADGEILAVDVRDPADGGRVIIAVDVEDPADGGRVIITVDVGEPGRVAAEAFDNFLHTSRGKDPVVLTPKIFL